MQELTLDDWLAELASASPTPGGGSATGVMASMGAALVSMVCNLTIGKPRYAEHEDVLRRILAEATELRVSSLRLAEDDAHVFDAVIAAYRLPRETPEQQHERTVALQAALTGAAGVPLEVAALSARIIGLAHELVDRANVNVLSDVAVAAAAAGAALQSAKINVTVNLTKIEDKGARDRLTDSLSKHLAAADLVSDVTAEVEKRLSR